VLPHHSFLWEGIDGSRVFTHFPPSDTYGGQMSVRELRHGTANFKDHDRATRSLYPFGWGDGGGGPTATMLESARRLADLDGLPRLTMEGPRAFFEAAEAEIPDPAVWVGELYLELHRGTYTSQAAVKRGNRRGEFALRDAELWSTLAAGTPPVRDDLERAWKTLLLHQFHDIIPGSGIHWVYRDAAEGHAEVARTAEAVTCEALASITAGVDTASHTHPVVVFNSLSHPRDELVELDLPAGFDARAGTPVVVGPDGRRAPTQPAGRARVLVQASAPPCGWAVHDLVTDGAAVTGPDPDLTAGARCLENGCLRVELDAAGLLTSVYDKHARREVLSGPGNLLQLHPDYPNFYDAWDVDRFYLDRVDDIVTLESSEIVEDGPLRVALRLVRAFGESRIVQTVSLAVGSPYVEFASQVEWHETNRFLKVAFPLAVHSPRATYEIQYGHVERPTHANTSWDVARFEVCAHKWADLSESGYGVALLNDCKYGYDVRGNVMRLSLLRAPTWPDPVADRGMHHFTYRLLPHAGDLRDAGVIDAGYDLNVALRTVATTPHAGPLPDVRSLVTVDRANVVVEVVKRPDDAGTGDDAVVLRMYEAWGRRGPVTVTTPWPLRRVARADLLEREEERLAVDGSTVTLEVTPFEIVTLVLQVRE
jgi:alpha-mannosidase